MGHSNQRLPLMDSFLLLTRPGFEGDCAAELSVRAGERGVGGYARAEEGTGWLLWEAPQGAPMDLMEPLPVFARTAWPCVRQLPLPAEHRAEAVVEALAGEGRRFRRVLLEHPDTNEGRGLGRFLRGFRPPLERALRRRGLLGEQAEANLHLFFTDSRRVLVGYSTAEAPLENGIPRLRLPREAPSRSALKLEEGWLRLLTAGERERWLRAGRDAVDLGAAPGGWSWQLARRGVRVTAVDHGRLDVRLLAEYPVTHVSADAFSWRPSAPVDWVVCDVVDKPARTLGLMEQWLSGGRARVALFNLKLPMKRRHATVAEALRRLQALSPGPDTAMPRVRAAHLYHDREEVTVAVLPGE